MNFWELVELDFFPEGYRVSIDSASFGEARGTTRSTGRARGLTGRGARRSQPHRQPICRSFYAAVRRPISARTHSPPTVAEIFSCAPIFRSTLGLRAPPETDLLVLARLSPPRQQRLRRYRRLECPDPRPVRTSVRARAKRG